MEVRKLKFAFLLIIITFFSCNQSNIKHNEDELLEVELDTATSIILKFSNTLFSLPSPHEATLFVKNNGVKFNKDLLNDIEKVSNYTTSFKKALNLGIYGTNLGYLNVYEQIPESIKYFNVIKKLSNDLGLYDSFNEELITSIENNLGNKDSLLYYISIIYQDANNYLNKNQRNGIGALIITGGWIESLHILTKSIMESDNYEIRNRIGDQKHPLDNLIDLLSPFYYQSEEYSNLIDQLVDLAYEFDGIIYNYSYEEPKIDSQKQVTVINSESRIVISDYHLSIISEKIEKIRNQIIT